MTDLVDKSVCVLDETVYQAWFYLKNLQGRSTHKFIKSEADNWGVWTGCLLYTHQGVNVLITA